MSSTFSARSRWASWCCLVAISVTTVFIFGRGQRRTSIDQQDSKRSNLTDEVVELAPTLADAHELVPIAALNSSIPPALTPQWRTNQVDSIAEHPMRAPSLSPSQSSIPDAFPLKPRLKDEPPAIGDAFVNMLPAIGQLQPLDSQSMPPISPFLAKPVLSTKPSVFAQSQPGLSSQSLDAQTAWPDQSFTPASIREKSVSLSNELNTPHLLTGAVVRPQGLLDMPSKMTGPMEAKYAKPQPPPIGNYILQPLRNNNVPR